MLNREETKKMIVKKHWLQTASNSSFDENYSHSYWRIALILLTIVSYVILILFNKINTLEINTLIGFSNEYSQWLHYIWYLIYLWQALWLIYGLTTILRKSSDDYFYKYPPVMHWLIYTNFLISNILNLCCTLLVNQHIYILSTFYYFLIFIASNIALSLSILQLHDYQREMCYTEKHTDIWLIRILVQNGLLIYSSWSFLLLLINLNLTLIIEFNVSVQIAHAILLCTLMLMLVIGFLLENFFLYKYLKFLFSSWLLYIVFIIIFIFEFKYTSSTSTATGTGSYDSSNNEFFILYISSIVCSCIIALLLMVKLAIFIKNEVLYKKVDSFM